MVLAVADHPAPETELGHQTWNTANTTTENVLVALAQDVIDHASQAKHKR